MATEALPNPLSGLQGIFDKILGASTKTDSTQSLDIQSLINQLTNVKSTENQNSTNNSTTQALTQLLSSLTGQTQGQTTNVQQTQANIDALRQVYDQQRGGITPDTLKAIFTEGAKAVPGLANATANAVGARAGGNSPLATALTSLSGDLTSKAAMMNQQMLADSASTANMIAQLTKSVTSTGTTNETTNQAKTDNTSATTTQTQQQMLQKLVDSLTTMNQSQNQQQTKEEDTDTMQGINLKQSAGAAGLAGLLSLLNSGGSGGAGGLPSWMNDIGKLFGGGSTPDYGQGDTVLDPDDAENPFDNPAWDWGDFANGGLVPKRSFADGGEVLKPVQAQLKLTESKSPAPSIEDLMKLIGGGGIAGMDGILGLVGGLGGSGGTGSGQQAPPGTPTQGVENSNGPGAVGNTAAPAAPSDAFGTPVGPTISIDTPTLGTVANVGINVATGNMIGLAATLGKLLNIQMNHNISTINPSKTPPIAPITPVSFPTIGKVSVAPGAGGDSGSDANAGDGPAGSVSVGSDADSANPGGVTGPGGETGATSGGGSADGGGSAGDNGAGGGGSGDNGDSGGGTGSAGDGAGSAGSGWANGGHLPKQKADPQGIKDRININVSGGEYIVPTDVVDLMGADFFDSLKLLYHTPAEAQ